MFVGGLTERERAAVGLAVAGLLLLAASLAGAAAPTHHGASSSVSLWIAASLVVAALAAGPGARVLAGGAGLGIAAGVLYGAGDVGTKAALPGGARLIFVPVLLACHGLAFVFLQLGFQRGGALATAGLASLWTNALPIAARHGALRRDAAVRDPRRCPCAGVRLSRRRRGPSSAEGC